MSPRAVFDRPTVVLGRRLSHSRWWNERPRTAHVGPSLGECGATRNRTGSHRPPGPSATDAGQPWRGRGARGNLTTVSPIDDHRPSRQRQRLPARSATCRRPCSVRPLGCALPRWSGHASRRRSRSGRRRQPTTLVPMAERTRRSNGGAHLALALLFVAIAALGVGTVSAADRPVGAKPSATIPGRTGPPPPTVPGAPACGIFPSDERLEHPHR